jgi:RNA polymerase sigma-70 factor (ECF subfamily)
LRRFARALLRGNREHADDLVQDSLERALSNWHRRRVEADLRSWVYTIIYNRFLTEKRRQRRCAGYHSLAECPDKDLPAVDGGQGSALIQRDLLRGFAELPQEQRAVLLLVGVEDFSYKDAARILGVPIGTVMSRLSRGRERLRQHLNGERAKPQIGVPRLDQNELAAELGQRRRRDLTPGIASVM